MTEKKSVTVTIYKNEYTLKGEAEPQHIIDLAQYIDTRMTEMGHKSSAPADKIAILVAMNVADELRRLEKINEANLKLIESLEKNLEEIKNNTDITIKNAASQNEEAHHLREVLFEEKQKLQAALQQKDQASQLAEDLKKKMEFLAMAKETKETLEKNLGIHTPQPSNDSRDESNEKIREMIKKIEAVLE